MSESVLDAGNIKMNNFSKSLEANNQQMSKCYNVKHDDFMWERLYEYQKYFLHSLECKK